jgi:SAM-dependent methyltransferase
MSSANPYDDVARATRYATLDIKNTYYLAYRDLPDLFAKYGMSGSALDYGCGTGRSTRFLHDHGFSTVGVDISEPMVDKACEHQAEGDYRVITPGNLKDFLNDTFDLVLSIMPFDSIATMQEKIDTLVEISRVLKPGGWKILVASSHDIYLREWVSFSAVEFPENRSAKNGDTVRVFINELGDRRPIEDTLWTEEAYHNTFRRTSLQLVETRHPIVAPDDDYWCEWISEYTHAPWVVFVLQKPAAS